MADPFAAAVGAVFRHHGIDAVVDPDGAARPVRLLPLRPDAVVDMGRLNVQSETAVFEIRAADAASVTRGTIIAIGAERRRVQATPRAEDPRRLKRHLDTVPA
ncbi:head-tail joining protein [Roseivivax isoporae]|uniref:Uncharacterized protein n=1 Tax=Roseivivax isoporae LMG 25204 TaxID=1449351 RepID=X7F242_9RHOB|nr:hypothetical protein [Roseivivax isoporae]ETX26855.1 hypothetical protein RISW2_18845 [Roseivivax isoporae LMG 25204]